MSSRTWAWWPTFEHFCAPGSHPWGVSAELKRVERAVDQADIPSEKWGVIARRAGADWMIVARRKDNRTVDLVEKQALKYDAARRGGARGNLGPVPPANGLAVRTSDLDL